VSLDGCQLTVRPTGGSAQQLQSSNTGTGTWVNPKRNFLKVEFIAISVPDPEPAPDPAIFFNGFQETTKVSFFQCCRSGIRIRCLFFHPSLLLLFLDPGFEIRDKQPGSTTLVPNPDRYLTPDPTPSSLILRMQKNIFFHIFFS
jgi:hypothetical protein